MITSTARTARTAMVFQPYTKNTIFYIGSENHDNPNNPNSCLPYNLLKHTSICTFFLLFDVFKNLKIRTPKTKKRALKKEGNKEISIQEIEDRINNTHNLSSFDALLQVLKDKKILFEPKSGHLQRL